MICKRNIFHKKLILFLGITALVCHFTACDTDRTDTEPEETDQVHITLSPFAASGTIVEDPSLVTDPDNKVTDLRILAFHSSDGLLAVNQYHDFTSQFDNPIHIQIPAGTYDFVFIANETSDASLSTQLGNMVEATATLTDLNGFSFSSAAFDASKNIPMSSACYDIIIDATLGLSEDGGSTYNVTSQTNPWEVAIERLGVRTDITLQTPFATVGQEFRALELTNIPDKVYILSKNKSGTPHYNNASYETASRTISLSDGDTGYTSGMQFNSSTYTYEWKKSRMILPESMFLNATNASQGVQLTAKYHTISDKTAVLGPLDHCSDGSNHGYNLPRNHHLTVNGTLNLHIDLTLDVMGWKIGLNEEVNTESIYRLTLSQAYFNLSRSSSTETLTITTNYPEGWTAEISSNASSVIPNTSLELSHYQGMVGATDVVLTRPSSTVSSTVYIHITAGNLTAIVQVIMPDGAT